MLLVLPVIEIKDGKCVRTIDGMHEEFCSDNPLDMARLWRKENAKTLHVTDVDGARQGYVVNKNVISSIVQTVDIPIEVTGGIRSFQDAKTLFDLGVSRIIIATMFIEAPEEAKRLLATYGSNKIALGIDAENGFVKMYGRTVDSGLTATSVALNAKQMGFTRLVYKDIMRYGEMIGPNIFSIEQLARQIKMDEHGPKMRITVAGGISNVQDLLTLQGLEPLGVDSVIVGRALYENKFSCQHLWRMSEAGNFPFTAKV
ncbi:MAG: 1-(5-phosphoribosyl)-5-[(5-phosphoribosylamino)methylideneamino] imidazole-4-carboxamide isomerase [Ignavibacteriales bacterium]|nr:1-(5-phosphoribosyl)-5-[(5-phosphoribosylamino)methylideneamino] imidazole-4-carboxamide isomerase [Ignavibacteriales bacterium]